MKKKKRSIGSSYRKDFIGSSTSSKGTANDPLARQKTIVRNRLTDNMISDLYATNRLFGNIVDLPAEDATREWVDITGIDDVLKEQISNKLSNLSAQNCLQKALQFERLRGDGFISIGSKHNRDFKISDPIDYNTLLDIEYLHAFSGKKMVDYIEDEDVFSPEYNNVIYYEINNNLSTSIVHKDRLLHICTRKIEDERRGIPLADMLYDILLVFDNALWSTGQLMYSMVSKKLKTDGIDFTDRELRQKMQNDLEWEFNTLTLAIIGKDDELEFMSPSVSLPLKDMYEFLWDMLACAARMPKSHITGQQQGAITGGQFDSLNYYMRIAGMQEAYLRQPIETIIDLNLIAKDSGVGNGSINPENVKYKMKFNPLWKLDDKADAEIRKINAEIDRTYIEDQVLSADEVRKKRFNMASLLENIDMSEEELANLAKQVDESMKEAVVDG